MHHSKKLALEIILTQLCRHHGRSQEGGQTREPATEASQRCDSRYLQDQAFQTFN